MKQLNWWKSIVSMGVILGSMPMVHLVARVLKDNYDGTQLLGAGMAVRIRGYDDGSGRCLRQGTDSPNLARTYRWHVLLDRLGGFSLHVLCPSLGEHMLRLPQ